LEQRRRRIGVVFEELRRSCAIEGEIEASEQRWLARAPGLGYAVAPRWRNGELRHPAVRDDMLGGVEAAGIELGGCSLQPIDLGGSEAIAPRLVPVRSVERVVREAHLFALRDPVGPWRAHFTFHSGCTRPVRMA